MSVAAQQSNIDVEGSFRAHHRLLWGLCYRMTGSAADADDLLQDTFARALAQPPKRGGDVRPWLVRVAMNLSRDLLRKRRRRGYTGPWLPHPVELTEDGWAATAPGRTAHGQPPAPQQPRYELAESASYAFLVALEALTPKQRAVLLLRDVLDYSVRETASALDMSEPNVKTTLHRARRTMASYDEERTRIEPPSPQTQAALQSLIAALVAQDAAAVERMLAADVRALSDGGGEFFAALKPVLGRDKVARFFLKISARRAAVLSATLHRFNGQPALLVQFGGGRPREAPWVLTTLDLNADGEIQTIYSVLASHKLASLDRGPTG